MSKELNERDQLAHKWGTPMTEGILADPRTWSTREEERSWENLPVELRAEFMWRIARLTSEYEVPTSWEDFIKFSSPEKVKAFIDNMKRQEEKEGIAPLFILRYNYFKAQGARGEKEIF